jgi:hypothetical protein
MSNRQTVLKVRAKLREIRHKPIKRGGNGQLLPLPQLALLHALGEGWESEVAVPTLVKRTLGCGFPTNYKIDLANKEKLVGIEVDGPSHDSPKARELFQKKKSHLSSLGWSLYRVSNERALQLYSTFTSADTLLTLLMES